jgi:Helix-turn-helix domain
MQTFNVVQAADYTGISKSSLDKLRVYGGGPPFIKVGARIIYDQVDLDAWLLGKRVANTSRSLVTAA